MYTDAVPSSPLGLRGSDIVDPIILVTCYFPVLHQRFSADSSYQAKGVINA
jgi:hypothetical protein